MNELSLYAPVRYELMLMLWIEENAGGALSPWFCIGEILLVVCICIICMYIRICICMYICMEGNLQIRLGFIVICFEVVV